MYKERELHNIAHKFVTALNKKFRGCKVFSFHSLNTGGRTYVTQFFNIHVDLNDVSDYAKANQCTMETAIKLLISHEIFHVLLGHFSSKYKNHDKNLLNIAGDLEINSYLGIQHPGITAADYGWSPLLSTEVYYQKLVELGEQNKEEKDADNSAADSGENTDDELDIPNVSIYNQDGQKVGEVPSEKPSNDQNSNQSQSSFNDMIESNYNIDIPDDVTINTTTSDLLGDNTIDINISLNDMLDNKKIVQETVTAAMRRELEECNIVGLEAIIKKLERVEKEHTIQPKSRISTYYKLNNRRNSDFILPGKKLEGGNTKKKHSKGLTIFIDVSSSTHGTIGTNLNKVAYRLHKEGATIVYYNSNISAIIKPEEAFYKGRIAGSTSITNTVKEYMRRYGDLERVYVFTDGEDRFTRMSEMCDSYKIFFIENRGTITCKEIYSDRNPQIR